MNKPEPQIGFRSCPELEGVGLGWVGEGQGVGIKGTWGGGCAEKAEEIPSSRISPLLWTPRGARAGAGTSLSGAAKTGKFCLRQSGWVQRGRQGGASKSKPGGKIRVVVGGGRKASGGGGGMNSRNAAFLGQSEEVMMTSSEPGSLSFWRTMISQQQGHRYLTTDVLWWVKASPSELPLLLSLSERLKGIFKAKAKASERN
ncbi:uncharacterized protein G2W53_043279 [Senna tora]|uniref:Uncharacterized protein n=1 Tax=Senna tora TaxID=362788 RepID=A0A834VZQ8_9FABA|nr:uncharacterized protein G2W53_043279 [Senna tora]